MKKISFFLFHFLIFSTSFSSCSYSQTVPENILTLELTFSVEGLPKDYLLAWPLSIVVADNNDIVIGYQNTLKVFDSSGKPKLTAGEPSGDKQLLIPTITETGYITITDYASFPSAYYLFDSKYQLIERQDLEKSTIHNHIIKEQNWMDVWFLEIYSFARDEKLMHVMGTARIPDTVLRWMYYERDGELKAIINFSSKIDPGIPYDVFEIRDGQFLYTLLKDRKFLYIQTVENRLVENEKWLYALQVLNLQDSVLSVIKVPYAPVFIPDSVINRGKKIPENTPENLLSYQLAQNRTRRDMLREIKVYPPLQALLTDGNIIFAFTFVSEPGKGNLADVIDGSTGSFICKAYFSFIPNVIKNGYAYKVITPDVVKSGLLLKPREGEDPVPRIEKYRINPAVYGK